MIEVEKKFHIIPQQEKTLISGAKFIKTVTNVDKYYDTGDFKLTTQDIWLRNRNGKFELKVPLNFSRKGLTDLYHEYTTDQEIRKQLQILPQESLAEDLESNGYSLFATIQTTRKKYKKEGFNIDIDSIDYGYELCEIELMVDTIEKTEQKILEFAKSNGLQINPIRGKLLEYLRRHRSDHYAALKKAGFKNL